jgi:putative SOS response-associated peptidase YedK
MCGRFTLTIEALEAQREFDLEPISEQFSPRYNIAPTQTIGVLSNLHPHKLEFMRWGLIPFWAKSPDIGVKMINARSETLSEKPAFRQALKQRRCLILADGFYEWKRSEGGKNPPQPYYFRLKEGKPFTFAGLWEKWAASPGGGEILSCTIITCAANDLVLPVHDRMPVILTDDTCWKWLENKESKDLLPLLAPIHSNQMIMYPVSYVVNKPLQDSPECISPIV